MNDDIFGNDPNKNKDKHQQHGFDSLDELLNEKKDTGFDNNQPIISRNVPGPRPDHLKPRQYYDKKDYEKGSTSDASKAAQRIAPSEKQSQKQNTKQFSTNQRAQPAGGKQKKDTSSKNGKKNKKRKKRHWWIYIVLALLLLCVGAFAYIWNSSFFTNDTDANGAGLDTTIGGIDKDIINLLVVGIDSDEGREENQLTDTIMVVSFNVKENKASVLQIPRDTYIGTQYTTTGKINALYSSGREYTGIEGLAQFLYDDFCIPIDHYATVTMAGFRQVIDSIGGVTVDVPYPVDLDGVELEAGVQTLDGNEAEKFIRQRHGTGYNNGDLDRLNVQRTFMASLVDQLLNTSKMQLLSLVPTLSNEMTTDMTTGEMTDLVSKACNLSQENILFTMVPGESTYVNTPAYGEQSVYSIHKGLLGDMINENFRAGLDPIVSTDIAVPEISNTMDDYDSVGGNVDQIVGEEDNNSSSNSNSNSNSNSRSSSNSNSNKTTGGQ